MQAYEFIIKNGIDTETSYKYTAGNGKASNCSRHWPPTSPVRIKDYKKISSNEPAMQAFAITNGPIAVGLDAAGPAWKHCECRSSLSTCWTWRSSGSEACTSLSVAPPMVLPRACH